MTNVFTPPDGGFEFLDHTADIWLVGKGENPSEVLIAMTYGLYRAISSRYDIEIVEEGELSLSAETMDVLLVIFLSELLYLLEAENNIFPNPEIQVRSQGGTIKLTIRGQKASFSIPEGAGNLEVKAISYHGSFFEMVGGQWQGKALLDI